MSSPAAANLRSSQDSKKKPRESPKIWGRIRMTAGISVGSNSISRVPAYDLEEVHAVVRPSERPGDALELLNINKPAAESDLFRAADLQSLPTFDHLDERCRL